jgi:hypothetical protein
VKVSHPKKVGPRPVDPVQAIKENNVNALEVSNDATASNGGVSGPEIMPHPISVSKGEGTLLNGDGHSNEAGSGGADKLIDFGMSGAEENGVVVTNGTGGLKDDALLHGSKETTNLLEF